VRQDLVSRAPLRLTSWDALEQTALARPTGLEKIA
jgi:hypothetical protein